MGRPIHKRRVLSNEKSITSVSSPPIPSRNLVLRPEDLERLCRLARLEVTPAEVPDVAAKLSSIVAMVDQLKACNTTGVTPMAHPLERAQRLRPDVVTETDRHELYQNNAPLVERDLYLVPLVIE
jgi:aspartyl-tRNA(Asn)/glutamyl-tRNA(Gln) amidotransferase subunit C